MQSAGTTDDLMSSVYQAEVDTVEAEQREPIPDVYNEYLEMRALGYTGYWSGPLGNQPHIWLLEINACREAENELQRIKQVNQSNRAKSNEQR